MTWGRWYWTAWTIIVIVTLAVPEFYALASNWKNTYSNWVWTGLDVSPGNTKTWTAVHFLAFGVWCVMTVWLTGHFFWRKWT